MCIEIDYIIAIIFLSQTDLTSHGAISVAFEAYLYLMSVSFVSHDHSFTAVLGS
jgi:hypothetical protein